MMIQLFMTATVLMTTFAACSNQQATTEAILPDAVQQTTTESKAMVATHNNAGLPSFTVHDVNGNVINLNNFKGKKVFVNLWASWCPPCRAEMPSIEKLYQSVDTGKVAFVMLALDNDFEQSKQFVKKQGLNLPVYYPTENLPQLFNVQGIPTTFIFNEQGALIQRIDGGDDYDTDRYRELLK
jgi:thiol-disulfide isomerase/thioredoxin